MQCIIHRNLNIFTVRKYVTAVLLTVAFASCYTQRTAERQVDKAHHKYPTVPAKFCSDKYPPQDSVSIVKEYIQGEDIIVLDTVVNDNYISDSIIITKYITKTITKTDTIRDTKYIQMENKAKVTILEAENSALVSKVEASDADRDKWRKRFYHACGALALVILVGIIKWKFL